MKAELDFTLWGPRDYVRLPYIHPEWRVADIGPGGYPLRRANVFIDKHQDILDAIDLQEGQEAIVGDLETGLPEIPDHYFDFIWISHCLEHVIELQKCIDTLNRIGERGLAVVPSFAKEAMLHFQEREHFWIVLPNPTHGRPPVFVEHNHGFLERLRDPLAQQATSFLYQTGSHHDCTAEQYMRAWWQEHEKNMDIVVEWTPTKPLEAIIIR